MGDYLRHRLVPGVVVRVAEDRGALWRVEPASDMAALGMDVGRALGGGAGPDSDACIRKDDPMWEPAPGPAGNYLLRGVG